jgi:hypothetical protein
MEENTVGLKDGFGFNCTDGEKDGLCDGGQVGYSIKIE